MILNSQVSKTELGQKLRDCGHVKECYVLSEMWYLDYETNL